MTGQYGVSGFVNRFFRRAEGRVVLCQSSCVPRVSVGRRRQWARSFLHGRCEPLLRTAASSFLPTALFPGILFRSNPKLSQLSLSQTSSRVPAGQTGPPELGAPALTKQLGVAVHVCHPSAERVREEVGGSRSSLARWSTS